MHAASRVLTRLNIETRAQHPEADTGWLELMSLDASRPRYLYQLMATYGFEAPIEAALALTPQLSDVVKLRQRARSGLIVQDLLSLGLTPARIARLPQCSQIVPFRDPSEALGWMYVMERTTLLHDAIRRHLQAHLSTVQSWCYLSAYEGVASMRWEELGQALDAVAAATHSEDQIVAAAKLAFGCHRSWFVN
jgi:heme oxygenase